MTKPISIREAKDLGLAPVTEADKASAAMDTGRGRTTFLQWCLQEIERMTPSGRAPKLVEEAHEKIAVWAVPLPPRNPVTGERGETKPKEPKESK
jgi:hypothetical protein